MKQFLHRFCGFLVGFVGVQVFLHYGTTPGILCVIVAACAAVSGWIIRDSGTQRRAGY